MNKDVVKVRTGTDNFIVRVLFDKRFETLTVAQVRALAEIAELEFGHRGEHVFLPLGRVDD